MLSFLAKIIIPFALSSTLFSTNKDHSKPIQQPLCANLETCQIIDLKNETLFQYYKQYVTKNDLSPDFSFENFVDFFNQTGLEFKEFYDQYISDRSTIIPAVTSFSSSADADKYMLSSTFYETTPISLFKNGAPLYNALSYSNVRVGDILFEDKIENFHHMGVVVDTNHSFTNVVGTYNTYIQTIEAVNSQNGVQYGYLDDAKSWTGLNNLQTVAINYHSFAEITISENWFATTIAASYIANSAGINERLITYANNLNSSKKTLSEYAIYRVE